MFTGNTGVENKLGGLSFMPHFDSVLKTSLSTLAGALTTWIAARYGRRVIVQIRFGNREVKVEAQTAEQAQKMLDAAENFQKKKRQ